MPALAASTADIVVVADADVWCDETETAVEEVAAGAGWAIPHRGVFRLTETATSQVLAGESWIDLELDERPYLGLLGGGIVVAHRETLLTIPLDPRFIGWGGEDDSWGMALRTMLGPPARGRGQLVHLWHPPQPRVTRRRGSAANWKLRGRYLAAVDDPAAMRRLLTEAHDALGPLDPSDHDRSHLAHR